MTETPYYDSSSTHSPQVRELLTLFKNRDLVWLFISKLNKTRYKRSVLGIVWTLLNPLLNMIVLTFAFSQVFRSSIPHYPVYVLSGLIFWNLLSQATIHAVNSLVWGGSILRRVYLPRSIFAVSAVGNGLLNLSLALVPLILIMASLGQPFHLTLLFLPFAVLLLAMFTLGVALIISTFAVYFVDVVEMYTILVQAWFFLTPIMYPNDILSPQLRVLLKFNPAYNLLELFRVPIMQGVIPDLRVIQGAIVTALLALLLGWWMFTRKADEFAFRI